MLTKCIEVIFQKKNNVDELRINFCCKTQWLVRIQPQCSYRFYHQDCREKKLICWNGQHTSLRMESLKKIIVNRYHVSISAFDGRCPSLSTSSPLFSSHHIRLPWKNFCCKNTMNFFISICATISKNSDYIIFICCFANG